MMKDESKVTPVLAQVREVLRSSQPELAAVVADVIDAVCRRHIEEVRAEIPTAAGLSEVAVLDDLTAVLSSVFQAFQAGNLDAISRVGPAHAAAREAQGFSMLEIFGEYVLLRRNLKRRICAQLRRDLMPAEEEALQSAIDAVMAAALTSLSAQREGRLRLETTALSDFLASLAHDLRNEINSSMLSMTLLEEVGKELHGGPASGVKLESDGEDRIRALLREVAACRASMESTVASMTRLLEAEKVRNQVEAHARPTDLLSLMKGIVRSADRTEQLRTAVSGRDHESRIEVTCSEEISLMTDPDLLSTVLANLIGNAVKFAPMGRIRFKAELYAGFCRIEVVDEGPGMTPEQVAKLFQRFERVGRRDGQGSGLGLFVVRRAAQLLGANVSVKSEPGRGSCFTVMLPVG